MRFSQVYADTVRWLVANCATLEPHSSLEAGRRPNWLRAGKAVRFELNGKAVGGNQYAVSLASSYGVPTAVGLTYGS